METQFIKLNMTPTGINPCFHVSQYDIGRSLGFMIYNGSEVVGLDSYTCTIEATRSDGVAITASVTTDDNIGTFETTATMTNKADKYRAQFVIADGDSNRIASLPFDMDVVKAAMDENSEAIEEDASLYQQYNSAMQAALATEAITREAVDLEKITKYDTVAQMVADTSLTDGMYAHTGGYYSVNDGGGALYRISGTEPTAHYETLTNGLYAELISDVVNVKQWGAVGDGETDDSTVLVACADYARTNGLPLYIPKECELLVADETTINQVNCIRCYGGITVANNGMLVIKNSSGRTSADWYIFHISGTLRVAGLKNSFIKIVNADTLELYVDGSNSSISSIAYTQFDLGLVSTLLFTGVNSGWINENQFFGGRISTLTVNGDYGHNNNHFYNPCLENGVVTFNCGFSNYIHNARFEGLQSLTFGANTRQNVVEQSYVSSKTIAYPSISHFNDVYGHNYFKYSCADALMREEIVFSKNSRNFDASHIRPNGDKLRFASGNYAIFESELIDITKAVEFTFQADSKFGGGYVELYDENGVQITTEPTYNPISGAGSIGGWNSDNHRYSLQTTQVSGKAGILSRYTVAGEDSGVKYVKFLVRKSGGNYDVNFLRVSFSRMNNFRLSPIIPPLRLTASSTPLAGDWAEGTYAENTDSTNPCAGWFYNNGAWHKLGEYTP